ncbi:hypothetical protein K493DRAFT_304963 [Basidiobolus meristosporus CBS 931.73]|uniref:Uncharacterized protein n=1 Tax=Basidiobolus meristosporus CBS 931.73 TaxID=1314790 RepID=A0A1Y1XXA2_9FUNG|nr:hypothetical protein K493DRAFT_304963 [Basidiobolus meristosporus CBS 931.73]|eukprot:ORX90381.1 hypothetical protein K493DRAFT_304963 [Basidiobolus meristosporus CBS 931.73]
MRFSIYCLYVCLLLLDTARSAVICRQKIASTTLDTIVRASPENTLGNRDHTSSDLKVPALESSGERKESTDSKCTCPKSCSKHGSLEPINRSINSNDQIIQQNFDLVNSSPPTVVDPVSTRKTGGCKAKNIEAPSNREQPPADTIESQPAILDGFPTVNSISSTTFKEPKDASPTNQAITSNGSGPELNGDLRGINHQIPDTEVNNPIREEKSNVELNQPETKPIDVSIDQERNPETTMPPENRPDTGNTNDIAPIDLVPEQAPTPPTILDIPIMDGIFAFLPRKSPLPFETVLGQSPPIVL